MKDTTVEQYLAKVKKTTIEAITTRVKTKTKKGFKYSSRKDLLVGGKYVIRNGQSLFRDLLFDLEKTKKGGWKKTR